MALPTSFQTAAINQITENLWSLLQSMHTWFAANPTANATQATNYLNGLAEPYPANIVRIADRAGAFNAIAALVHPYEGKANAYLSLRQFMLDHPLAALQSIDPDAGRSVTTKAEALARRMLFAPVNQWSVDGSVTSRTETRDPSKGNVRISLTYVATVGGTNYTLRQSWTAAQRANGEWYSTPGAWSIL